MKTLIRDNALNVVVTFKGVRYGFYEQLEKINKTNFDGMMGALWESVENARNGIAPDVKRKC